MSLRIYRIMLGCLLAVVAVGLGSCGHRKTQQGIAQSEWEKLIAIRTEAKTLYAEMMKNQYETEAMGQPSRSEEITSRYQSLLDKKNIQLLQRIQDSYQKSSEERQVQLLRLFLIRGALKLAAGQSIDYLSALQSEDQVGDGKKSVAPSCLSDLIARENSRTRRQMLYEAQLPMLVKANAVYEKIRGLEDSLLLEFGYGDMTSFLEEEQGCDLGVLSQQAEKLVKDTDSLTYALLAEMAPKLTGVKLDALRGYDLPLLEGGKTFSGRLAANKAIEGLKTTLAQMGIPLDSLPGIKIAASERSCRFATYSIQVPDDIRVPLPDLEGAASYAAAYHEMGHAVRAACVTERDFEFAYLDAQTLTEAGAFLIEQLLDQPGYLRDRVGLPEEELEAYSKYRRLVKLITIRSYCGDLLYEQSLYSGADNAKAAYERIKQPLLGIPWSDVEREGYLSRADYLASASYLRGWFLAAQIHEKLQSFVGPNYWSIPATGQFLRKMWSSGSRYSPEEVAQSLGIGAIAPEALLRQLNLPTH